MIRRCGPSRRTGRRDRAAGAAVRPPSAQTRADLIPLGQSAASGAVCQAVRDYDDPVVQGAGRRAWNIRAAAGGRAARAASTPYPQTTRRRRPWETALDHPRPMLRRKSRRPWRAWAPANRRACRSAWRQGPLPGLHHQAAAGTYAAEGAAQIADVLETGLKVVSGKGYMPAANGPRADLSRQRRSRPYFGGATGGLARAQAAATADLGPPARPRLRPEQRVALRGRHRPAALVADAERAARRRPRWATPDEPGAQRLEQSNT